MNKMTNYETYDMACAAALITEGIPVSFLDKTKPKKAKFVFQNEKAKEISQKFWNDDLKQNPRIYFDNVKMLKNRIFSN